MTALVETLHEPPLRIRYMPGRSERLVVSFAGVGSIPHEEPPAEFFRLASTNGENHVLFISDQSRSWMNAPGIADLTAQTVRQTAAAIGAARVVAIGNSMGGSAALILAALMPLDGVLAIVPQYSVHPRIMPDEPRWERFREQITDWPFATVPEPAGLNCPLTVLHGATAGELIHADRFGQAPNMMHFIFPGLGHGLARKLRGAGYLEPIVTNAILGRPRRVRLSVRTAGGMNRHRFDRTRNTHSSRRH